MGFTKKTWKNRIAEYINRRLLTMEDGSTNLVTVARDEGTISQEGDAFNAANMNDLEDRIEAGFEEVSQSLTNIETGEIEFAGTVDKTKTGTSGQVVKNGNIAVASFEFSFKTGYPFTGNAQIGILPFKAKHASYCGFACNLNNNQMASVYVKDSSIFLQSNNTIPENTTLRGGIIYFS